MTSEAIRKTESGYYMVHEQVMTQINDRINTLKERCAIYEGALMEVRDAPASDRWCPACYNHEKIVRGVLPPVEYPQPVLLKWYEGDE